MSPPEIRLVSPYLNVASLSHNWCCQQCDCQEHIDTITRSGV